MKPGRTQANLFDCWTKSLKTRSGLDRKVWVTIRIRPSQPKLASHLIRAQAASAVCTYRQQTSNGLTRATRQFPPSPSGSLYTNTTWRIFPSLLMTKTTTTKQPTKLCQGCRCYISITEMRLGSATESIVFVKEASFLFPQRRLWKRRGSFVGTTTGTGRQKNEHKQNQTAAGSSLTE